MSAGKEMGKFQTAEQRLQELRSGTSRQHAIDKLLADAFPAPVVHAPPSHLTIEPVPATEMCRMCPRHRLAERQRGQPGHPGGPDQCECLREYRLRAAKREVAKLGEHKAAG